MDRFESDHSADYLSAEESVKVSQIDGYMFGSSVGGLKALKLSKLMNSSPFRACRTSRFLRLFTLHAGLSVRMCV